MLQRHASRLQPYVIPGQAGRVERERRHRARALSRRLGGGQEHGVRRSAAWPKCRSWQCHDCGACASSGLLSAALAGSTRPCPGDEAGPLLTQPPLRCSSQPPPKSPIATGYGPGPPGGAGARAAPIPNLNPDHNSEPEPDSNPTRRCSRPSSGSYSSRKVCCGVTSSTLRTSPRDQAQQRRAPFSCRASSGGPARSWPLAISFTKRCRDCRRSCQGCCCKVEGACERTCKV